MQIPHPEQWIVLDIETVSQQASYHEMPELWQHMWNEKIAWQLPEGTGPDQFYDQRAAILAEFGKIVCITVGYFRAGNEGLSFRIKSFSGKEEGPLLETFTAAMSQLIQAKKNRMWFVGHNIREFDIPYLCRRLLINRLPLPSFIDFQSQKPWDVPLLDTMQLWKFGDYKNYTSLNLLAACMGIESPKEDMDGSMVGEVYWKEDNLPRIVEYCQRDVITVANLLLRFQAKPLLQPDQVVIS